MARKYLVYEGKNLIGEMNSVEGEKLLHVSRRRFAECANNGGKLKGRYEVKLLKENTLRKKLPRRILGRMGRNHSDSQGGNQC